MNVSGTVERGCDICSPPVKLCLSFEHVVETRNSVNCTHRVRLVITVFLPCGTEKAHICSGSVRNSCISSMTLSRRIKIPSSSLLDSILLNARTGVWSITLALWLFGAYQHLSEMFVIEIGLNKDLHDPYAEILFALNSRHHKASAYGQEFFSAFELDQQSFQLNIGRQQASLRGSTDGIASLPIYRR